ncbi:ABC transporter permease subunit [Chitinibacter bivalviorum]|uniref:ABC transporter permease subunit n=1 Tax=Chitinibacter bivalviorum TaxID=2739434 RepID=A0A7H9BN72_9NEIS|nr:ABC transporter permease subunit [Chitinibacter bivalviorum]QLG89668.1 ABC transporter permease subunit [Chitinibacter bivalviorum]
MKKWSLCDHFLCVKSQRHHNIYNVSVKNLYLFTKLTILSGVRNRAIWLILFIEGLLLGVAYLAGSFSGRQPVIVSLDVGYSGVRIGLMFLALAWTQELLQKDLDRKTVHWSLSYPCARSIFLAGKLVGIALLLLFAAILFAMPLALIAKYANWGYIGLVQPNLSAFPITIMGLWLESIVILAFTVCMACISTTPFLAIGLGLMFSLAGRGLAATLNFLQFSDSVDPEYTTTFIPIANFLRWLLPDLSALDWRQAVLYSNWAGLEPKAALIMASGYTLIFTALAMQIFRRRALN